MAYDYDSRLWTLPQAQAGAVSLTSQQASKLADPYQEYRAGDAKTYQSLMSNPGQIDTHALYQFLSDRGTDNVLRRFKGEKSGNLMAALQQEGMNQAGKYWTTLADMYGKSSNAYNPISGTAAGQMLMKGQSEIGDLERMAAGNRAGAQMQRSRPQPQQSSYNPFSYNPVTSSYGNPGGQSSMYSGGSSYGYGQYPGESTLDWAVRTLGSDWMRENTPTLYQQDMNNLSSALATGINNRYANAGPDYSVGYGGSGPNYSFDYGGYDFPVPAGGGMDNWGETLLYEGDWD